MNVFKLQSRERESSKFQAPGCWRLESGASSSMTRVAVRRKPSLYCEDLSAACSIPQVLDLNQNPAGNSRAGWWHERKTSDRIGGNQDPVAGRRNPVCREWYRKPHITQHRPFTSHPFWF